MNFIFAIFFILLGLVIGSFLNVVIFRINTNKSFGGRSKCMVCQSRLRWYDLFPLFSFIFLFGRCRYCKTKISIQYPLVEIFSALISVGLFYKFQNIFYTDIFMFCITMAYYTFMFSILLVIAIYDLKHKIIPNSLAFILAIISFIGMFFFSDFGFYPHIPSIWGFFSGVIMALPFALVWLISGGRWMGLGDAKLAIGIGWLVGIGRIFSTTVLSFWSGAVVGLVLIFLSKKYSIKSEIPFAPFLVLGALLSFIFNIYLFQI